jgi:predicted DNA-binding protein YlxM (UPF0122 family)
LVINSSDTITMDNGECVDMIQTYEENPNMSTLEIAHHLQVSQQTVQHILNKHNFFPTYHERYMLFLKTTLSVGLHFVLILLIN